MVEITLTCAIVGGGVFDVPVENSAKVSALKEIIKHRKKNDLKAVDADNLQLFLAKVPKKQKDVAGAADEDQDMEEHKEGEAREEGENVEWLDCDAATAVTLDDLKKHFEFMKPTLYLNSKKIHKGIFGDGFKPGEDQVHVLVVVPPSVGSKRPAAEEKVEETLKRLKLLEPKTLPEFAPLSVNEVEFQLDNLEMIQASARPIVQTPALHTFWEGFGDFPPHYLVRMEEVVFWKVIKKLLFVKDRVVIVGSPGVGKSCFLMLVAFYLACVENRKVLVIRRVKERKSMSAVVFFDGQGSYARLSNLTSADIKAIRVQAQGALVLVDGFNQAAVEDGDKGYMPFDFLATSCQYDAKQDDFSHVVVLPAWRQEDLLKYADLTDWVHETGLRKVKRDNTPIPELASKQYFYSGGSLREFCKSRKMLVARLARDCGAVANDQAFDLVYNYGGGRSRSQVDRLRRHYITDRTQVEHYLNAAYWTLSVDSGYVLDRLGWRIDITKQLDVYRYAQSVGAGFYGVAYELLLHKAVREASAERRPIVLKVRDGSDYETIEINVRSVVRSGDDKEACYECLPTLEADTYWHPAYPFFPFIDAVATCTAFLRGNTVPEKVVAYIQVTIADKKTFKTTHFNDLESKINANPSLKDLKRVFVVVGPDASVCARFQLHEAPTPATIPTMVSCFDPEQLKPKRT